MIHTEFVLVLLGAALVPSPRERSLASLGAIASGLGYAGLTAGPGPAEVLPPGFVAVEAALLFVGAALAIAAAQASIRDRKSKRGMAGAASLAGGGLGFILAGARYAADAPVGGLVGALTAVALV